ncbi:hypothetical protein B0F90DRAFT_1729550 [Multifurca ochricompacta]|uniref:Uncharacterized protein n=1 Tax=Multifurca ochricompacta TaxID=376703 RepID=A0AAD4M2L9_9AGAM|nr:hypothetical protein B0F90DRAFT_1729550 [Multifurca ochricompacta]
MTTTLSATRKKIIKINGHSDNISSQDPISSSDSPKHTSQFAFECLDSTHPLSSSEDDSSDISADKNDSQEPARFTTAPHSKDRAANQFDADGSGFQGPPKHSVRSSFWTDFDPSIVVAVISPLMNWLTGTDYLKNLFLVLFLIVYLHQLVQVPWELYHAARQRRPHPSFRSLNVPELEEVAITTQTKLAAAELRRHEFAYLFISMISPFAGASLLRSVLKLISGVDAISWFSTTLFVLAAGIRPWGHLISRLQEHTTSLHDFIHYPSPDTQLIADSHLRTVFDRISSLEQELSTLKRLMVMRAYVEDMHNDLSSALQNAERVMRKQERKTESARMAYDTRFAGLEKAVSRIERTRGERPRRMAPSRTTSGMSDDRTYSRLGLVIGSIFRFLRTAVNVLTFDYFDRPSTPSSPKVTLAFMGARPSLHHAKTPNRLETIEEDATEPATSARLGDDLSSSEHGDNEAPLRSHQSNPDIVGASRKRHLGNLCNVVDVIANIVSLPYHLALGILLAPLRRFSR